MHQAFWDSLKKDLDTDPPSYEHAFVLLQEIKKTLLSLLPQDRTTSLHKRWESYKNHSYTLSAFLFYEQAYFVVNLQLKNKITHFYRTSCVFATVFGWFKFSNDSRPLRFTFFA